MNSRIVIALLCAGAIAFACGPRPHESEASPPLATVTPPARTSKVELPAELTAGIASSLSLNVTDDVELRLHVTNTSDKKLELTFPSGQTHDFYVLDSAGREVWRWSEGRLFTQALQKKLLDAGATVSYGEEWPEAATAGTYTAVAVLKSTSHPVERKVEFTLK
jgi:hypothetical protein